MIHNPLQALKSVKNATAPPRLIPNSLLGGSSLHLREIKLDGIAFPFPAAQQLLLSTYNLVNLHLSNIPNEAYFSPDELIAVLSTLVRLKSLTVGFHSPASRPLPPPSPPSGIAHRPPTKRTNALLPHTSRFPLRERIPSGIRRPNIPAISQQNNYKTLQPDPIRTSPILSVHSPS